MGANMARRLKDTGFSITSVFDVRPEAASALAKELGCEAAASLARVTERADVVITVVTDDKAMRSIFAAKGDSLLVGAKGRTFINCATITPSVHVEVDSLARKAGAAYFELVDRPPAEVGRALQETMNRQSAMVDLAPGLARINPLAR